MNSNPRLFSFVGGTKGEWKVVKSATVRGDSLLDRDRLDIVTGCQTLAADGAWVLHGVTSNDRYITRPEKEKPRQN